ncbi:hypothetical protein HPB52_003417 [Rhipicephalus sanguineus]|uniref:CCHC-type domain-containing protein n=1 Tax=Rhipicephalus sanguineus TaxID=34632 RepID=A0A9D4PTZ3_RHISA|nr:hypothetical protein HPB52_003417 [Rhipicephalus sanguineus]
MRPRGGLVRLLKYGSAYVADAILCAAGVSLDAAGEDVFSMNSKQRTILVATINAERKRKYADLKLLMFEGEKIEVTTGNSLHVTFEGSEVPSEIYLFKQRRPIRARLPRPLQCVRCGQYGHATATCTRNGRCLRCGRNHTDGPCTAERPRCGNCQGPHASNEPRCPSWQLQRQAAFILASSNGKLTRREALDRARSAAKAKQDGIAAANTSATRPGHTYATAAGTSTTTRPTGSKNPPDPRRTAKTWRIFGAILRPLDTRFPALAIAVARGLSYQQLAELLADTLGCSPALALRLFNGLATARILYGLPLANISKTGWEKLAVVHRTAIRQFFSLPYSSPEGPTLAEAGDMPLPLSADIRALNHIGRMKRTHHGQQLIFPLDSLPHSRMGQCVAAYRALVSHSPDVNDLDVPPYRHRPLTIRTNIPGVETLDHILLQCVHYSEERRALIRSYREQGLATNSVDEFLFPSVQVDTVKRAFNALLNFFQSSALFERL